MNTVPQEQNRKEESENIRQLFTRQHRDVTSVHEANERLSGATPICSVHVVKFHATNAIPLSPLTSLTVPRLRFMVNQILRLYRRCPSSLYDPPDEGFRERFSFRRLSRRLLGKLAADLMLRGIIKEVGIYRIIYCGRFPF